MHDNFDDFSLDDDHHHQSPPTNHQTPTWGGRRRGAGAPKGNLNAIKTGLHSPRVRGYLHAIVRDPAMRQIIFTIMKVEANGGDLKPVLLEALRGIPSHQLNAASLRSHNAAKRRRRARFIHEIRAWIERIPPELFSEPPPQLILGDDGHPYVHTHDLTGAPFNPLTGNFQLVRRDDPAALARATRQVQRQISRKYNTDLIAWFHRAVRDIPNFYARIATQPPK